MFTFLEVKCFNMRVYRKEVNIINFVPFNTQDSILPPTFNSINFILKPIPIIFRFVKNLLPSSSSKLFSSC